MQLRYTEYLANINELGKFDELLATEHVVDQLAFAAFTQSIQFRSLGMGAPSGLAGHDQLRSSGFVEWTQAHWLALSTLRYQRISALPAYGFTFTPIAAAELEAHLVHFFKRLGALELLEKYKPKAKVEAHWEEMVSELVEAVDAIWQDDAARQAESLNELLVSFTQIAPLAARKRSLQDAELEASVAEMRAKRVKSDMLLADPSSSIAYTPVEVELPTAPHEFVAPSQLAVRKRQPPMSVTFEWQLPMSRSAASTTQRRSHSKKATLDSVISSLNMLESLAGNLAQ